MINDITQFIERSTGVNPAVQVKLAVSLAIILGLLLLRYVILRIVWHRTEDVRIRYIWQKALIYIAVVFSLLLIGKVWFKNYQSITTYLGLLTAGLVIALKDPLTNVAGWLF
ncbi:MAG: mechanosensitive ion channel family protein, partial [bacterium]